MEEIRINETNSVLPQTETAVDNLTEFNTTYNRQISAIQIETDQTIQTETLTKNPRKRRNVVFNDEGVILDPTDVDQHFGRLIPLKRFKIDDGGEASSSVPDDPAPDSASGEMSFKTSSSMMTANMDEDLQSTITENETNVRLSSTSMDVDIIMHPIPGAAMSSSSILTVPGGLKNTTSTESAHSTAKAEAPKKTYAKETWPGRRPKLDKK